VREPWTVPERIESPNGHLVPFQAGVALPWRLEARA